jgi:hypothetical protein
VALAPAGEWFQEVNGCGVAQTGQTRQGEVKRVWGKRNPKNAPLVCQRAADRRLRIQVSEEGKDLKDGDVSGLLSGGSEVEDQVNGIHEIEDF